MGTLAYDPDRLAVLATALGGAGDALALLGCADPEAQPALAAAGAAATAVDGWRVTALTLAGCGVLTDYQPLSPASPDLAHAAEYVLAQLYGWRLSTDPTGSSWFVPPAMEGAALGHLISTGPLTFETPDAIAALRSRLDAVLVDAAGRSAFVNNLTVEGAAQLAEQLAAARATALAPVLADTTEPPVLPDDIARQVAAVDGVLGHLAAIAIDPNEPLSSAREVLSSMRPYTAALLIAQMPAPSEVIGELAVETMTRYVASFASDDAPLGWELPDSRFLGIGDLLLPKIAAGDAIVANHVLHRLMDLNPSTILDTVRYAASTTGLVVRATDPSAIDITSAGATVRRYLDFLWEPMAAAALPSSMHTTLSAWDAQVGALAPVIAPWLLQFTSRTSEWGWDDQEGDDALGWILEDDDVLNELLARAGEWSASAVFSDPGDDPDALTENLAAAGSMVGEMQAFLEKYTIDAAQAAQAQWDFFVGLVPKAVGKAVGAAPIGKVPGTLIVKGTPYAVGFFSDRAQENGWFGAPRPLHEVLNGIQLDSDHSVAVAAYLALGAMTDALMASGTLPASATWPPPPGDVAAGCPARDYLKTTKDWLGTAYLDNEVARLRLENAMLRFVNERGSEQSCQELQFSGAAE
jgi:hypothetical protein